MRRPPRSAAGAARPLSSRSLRRPAAGTGTAGPRPPASASGAWPPGCSGSGAARSLRCCAAGVPAGSRASRPRPAVPGSSTSDSSPRRSCWVTRCSTAGATPAPSAAAAQAAVWLGNTPILFSGIPQRGQQLAGVAARVGAGRIHQPAPLPWRCPRSRDCPAVTTTRRYLKIGSLTTGAPDRGPRSARWPHRPAGWRPAPPSRWSPPPRPTPRPSPRTAG